MSFSVLEARVGPVSILNNRPAESEGVLSLAITRLRIGQRDILGQIALTVRRAETVAITGPSGIGKTTLLRTVAGLEPRFEGDVYVSGRIAFVFQEPTLLPWRTARDNLCLTANISLTAADRALEEVGLGEHAEKYPKQLSLGQQRRLSLARAFAVEPDLLLMDEPFVSLDAETAHEMMALFATLRARRSTATLLVTHVVREAEMLASRIIRLEGSPATIVEET